MESLESELYYEAYAFLDSLEPEEGAFVSQVEDYLARESLERVV